MPEVVAAIIWFLVPLHIAAGLACLMGFLSGQYSDNNAGGRHKRTFLVAAAIVALGLGVLSGQAPGIWPVIWFVAIVAALTGFAFGLFVRSARAGKTAVRLFMTSFWVSMVLGLVANPVTQKFLAGLVGAAA